MHRASTLSWQDFGDATTSLAEAIAADGYRPDIILAIARGGLFVAGALGYALGVKNLYVTNVEFYTGVDQRLDLPVMLPPVPNTVDLIGSRVLIADDIADTGATLKLVQEFCDKHVAETRCAVIFEKDRSLVKSDYVWQRRDDWIDFPWDAKVSIPDPPPPRAPEAS